MAGIGFVRDAQNTARANRENVKNRRNFTKTHKYKTPDYEYNFKKLSPEELRQFRVDYLAKKRKDNLKWALRMSLTFVVLALAVWWLFW